MAKEMVVDVDGHVVEPWNLWERYMEEPFKAIGPKMVMDNRGHPRFMVEGKLLPKPEGKGAGNPFGVNGGGKKGYGEQNPEGLTPELRVKAMDLDGIDVGVLFPTQGLYIAAIENPKLATAVHRAYNDWLADFVKAAPARFVGVAALPLQDVQEAVKEARRTVKEYDFKGMFVRPNPVYGRNLDDPAYDPLYAELQELDVPLMLHEGTSSGPLPAPGIERWDSYFHSHTISHPAEQMLAALAILGGGVCERFPRLRVAFLEAGASWLPYWLWRLDEHVEKRRRELPWLKLLPSEYFHRQCVISCDPDEATVHYAVDFLGEDKVLFASDFPHWDGEFPGSVAEIRENPKLSENAKRAILGENARRFLKLN